MKLNISNKKMKKKKKKNKKKAAERERQRERKQPFVAFRAVCPEALFNVSVDTDDDTDDDNDDTNDDDDNACNVAFQSDAFHHIDSE